MNKKLLVGFLIVMSIFITSCGNNTPTPTPELPVIKISWVAWPGFYPIVLVKELGLDKKHGFQLDLIFNKDITDDDSDWQLGKLDASFSDLDQVSRRSSQRPGAAKVIFMTDRSGGDVLVAMPEIKTIADLKGKRIGTIMGATYGELMVRRMLEANNLSLKEVELLNIDGSDVPDAMPKLIEAGVTWEPHLAKAQEKGFNILYSSSAKDALLPLTTVLMIQTTVIQNHPEAVRGLVAAWFEAVALWQADPTKYGEMVAKIVGGTGEEAANSQANFISLEQNMQRFKDGSLVKETEISIDFLTATGQLNNNPDIKSLFDDSFLKP